MSSRLADILQLCRDGDLDNLRIMMAEHGDDFTTAAMDQAAKFGHLEVVQYLHENGKYCTTEAMNWAAGKGHLKVLKYLREIGKDCTTDAMSWAASNGHLEVVKYLHEYKIGEDWTKMSDVINLADLNNHSEVVKYLCAVYERYIDWSARKR